MLKIFNTLSRKKEVFKPFRKDRVGFYACGPTVYNFAHIGNLRTYIFEDILRRTLVLAGYRVQHVMNTTDVDDKTIHASIEAGKSLKKFTRYYEKSFLADLKRLNVSLPITLARATEHIPEMIALVQKLLDKKMAYIKEGSVYFDISKFKSYGKLAHLRKKGLKAGARIDVDEYAKDEAQDFVLWKGRKQNEPYWRAPFGDGRPGWHIECSAMSMKHLGSTLDLHTAAVDLIFPHHENEIAQSEAATRKKFVRYWMHGEHLLVEGKKMSKSLRNIFTLRDIEEKGFNPLSFRYLAISSHYRSKLNFTWESLRAAEHSLNRVYDFVRELKQRSGGKTTNHLLRTTTLSKDFKKAVFNDLNTPRALAVLWKLIKDYHKNQNAYNLKLLLEVVYDFDKVFGLNLRSLKFEKIPTKIQALIKEREGYRSKKEWQKADEIREKIRKLSYTTKDTPDGTEIEKTFKRFF